LSGKLATALVAGAGTVILTSFAAVAREGIETSFFFFAAVTAAGQTTGPVIGFALGISVAVTLGYLLYRRSVKINLKKFFAITGYFLIVVAAGVLAYGIAEYQEIGLLPGGSALAFNVSGSITEDDWLGAFAAGLFNFNPETSWLQLSAWVIYVVTMLIAFTREVKSSTKVALDLKRRD
jgi:high-affinity iron transporter